MKLLVSELGARSRYVSREFFHTMNILVHDYGWKHIETDCLQGQTGKVEAIFHERFGELPSTILFWEGYHVFATILTDLLRMNCRKCVFMDDLHSFNELAAAMKRQTLIYCDTIFSTYEYVLDGYYPFLRGMAKKIVWSPHAASTDFLVPFNERPEPRALLSGNINDRYPLRMRVKALHDAGGFPIAYCPHPGYDCNFDYARDPGVGRNFARTLSRYLAAFTDCLTYRYLVAKYLEIPATGALLLGSLGVEDPLRALGLEEGVHYIGVSDTNIEEKIRYVVDPRNYGEIDAIRRRGHALVWERHTTSHRAQAINEACIG